MNPCLPVPPSQMTDEHLANAIRFHDRRARGAEAIIMQEERNRQRHIAALTSCLTEHAEREGRKQAAAAAEERARQEAANREAAATFERAMRAVFPRRDPATGIDTVSLLRRMELLELANAALAAKVAQLSRRKKKVRK